MDSELKDEIESTIVHVHNGRYAYIKSREMKNGNCFMITKDKDEITLVVEEKEMDKINYDKIERWFKLIEFKITKPFVCIGFLATISKVIAEKGINILIVSTFSKDYALIREENIDKALLALKEYGFNIE